MFGATASLSMFLLLACPGCNSSSSSSSPGSAAVPQQDRVIEACVDFEMIDAVDMLPGEIANLVEATIISDTASGFVGEEEDDDDGGPELGVVEPIGILGTKPSDLTQNVAIIFETDDPEEYCEESGDTDLIGLPVPQGNIVIIAENLDDDPNDGDELVDCPDDGFEPGMIFEIDFGGIRSPFVADSVTLLSMTFIDFENKGAGDANVFLYDVGDRDVIMVPIALEELICDPPDSAGEDGSVCKLVFPDLDGDGKPGVSGVTLVEVEFSAGAGESGGIDDIEFMVEQ